MRPLTETLGGLWELFLLLLQCRFRLAGPYLRWRYETAFGGEERLRPPRLEHLRRILAYGRWVHGMKREMSR
jgi:hypothetical protein